MSLRPGLYKLRNVIQGRKVTAYPGLTTFSSIFFIKFGKAFKLETKS